MKEIIGIWLLAQIAIVPSIIIDEDGIFVLLMDFVTLFLLLVTYLGLKLIGV